MQAQLSREELGRRAGLSEKQIGLIERGQVTSPRMDTMRRIARVLKVDDLTLLFDPEDRYFG